MSHSNYKLCAIRSPSSRQQQQPSESKAIKIEAPPQASSAPSQAPKSIAKGTVPQLLPGTAYPAQSTSTIDVNGNPVYPPQGKEIMQVDMDADIAEEQRIWRRPGEDQTDYFNYGFDEFTWEMYRQRHAAMAQTIQQQKSEVMQMEQMMNMNQMPGMPNNPGLGAGAMDEQKQMQMVIQRMQNQGLDPSQMNFTEFAAFMQMPGQDMGSGFGGPGGQQHGGNFHQGNHGGGRGGRGGRGRGW
jgi:pre-mRNA 3'-end-processing factor FIP1